MNASRILLAAGGAIAVAAIAFAVIERHAAQVSAPALVAMLLGTYAAGLALGRLTLNRKG